MQRRIFFGAIVMSAVAINYVPYELDRARVTGKYLWQLPVFAKRPDR